jgi:hypothetical protein
MYQALLNVVVFGLTAGAPILLVTFLTAISCRTSQPIQRPRIRPHELALALVAMLLTLVVAGALTWIIEPGYPHRPSPILGFLLVLVGPSLLASAGGFGMARMFNWPLPVAFAFAVVVGYVMMALCLLPAAVFFVNLGGDTL